MYVYCIYSTYFRIGVRVYDQEQELRLMLLSLYINGPYINAKTD